MNAQDLTKALGGRWTGASGVARCPAHDDREPSLSIRDGADGEPVVNCFAGCDWRDVKDALRADGLLPERAPGGRRRCAAARHRTLRSAVPSRLASTSSSASNLRGGSGTRPSSSRIARRRCTCASAAWRRDRTAGR